MVALRKLPNCCACISLKTGTLIIGSLGLVGSVILTLASIGFIASQQWVINMMDQTDPGWREDLDMQTVSSGLDDYDDYVMLCDVMMIYHHHVTHFHIC